MVEYTPQSVYPIKLRPLEKIDFNNDNENLKEWKNEVDQAINIDTAKTIIVSAPYYDDAQSVVTKTNKGHKRERIAVIAEIPFKVKYIPGNCTKCNNRRHKGMFKSSRGNQGYNGIIPCSCLKKAIYIPTKEEVTEANEKAKLEQEKLQMKPVDFVNSSSI